MPVDESTLKVWNKALLSIYAFGRPLRSVRPRRVVASRPVSRLRARSLEDAVADLTGTSFREEARRPISLALADLCRTRASVTDPAVAQQIGTQTEILIKALYVGGPGTGGVDALVRAFEALFVLPPMHTHTHSVRLDPEAVYLKALDLMTPLVSGGRTGIAVNSYSYKQVPRL